MGETQVEVGRLGGCQRQQTERRSSGNGSQFVHVFFLIVLIR
jgi:hypothetical protein